MIEKTFVDRMIVNTEEVLERSLRLIEEAKRTLHEPANLDTLTQAAKKVTQVLES